MKKTIGKIKYVLAAAAMCLCAAGGLLWGTEFSVPRIAYAADPVMHEDLSHSGWVTLDEQTTELTDGTKYYLSNDVTITEYFSVVGTVEICLNGYRLTLSGGISVEGGSLTLWDCEQGDCQQHTADNGTAHKGEITGAPISVRGTLV